MLKIATYRYFFLFVAFCLCLTTAAQQTDLSIELKQLKDFKEKEEYTAVFSLCEKLLKDPTIYNSPQSIELLGILISTHIKTQDYTRVLDLLEELEQQSIKYHIPSKQIRRQQLDYLAVIHYTLKNYALAAQKNKEKFLLSDSLNAMSTASVLNNIGLCFFKDQQLDSAQLYFDLALSKIKQSGYPTTYSYHFENVVKANSAAILTEKEKYAEALPFYFKELEYCEEYREYHIIYGAYYKIAETYYYLKQPQKALNYIDSFENYPKSGGNINTLISLHRLKAKCLLAIGQEDRANASFKLAEHLADSADVQRKNSIFTKALNDRASQKKDLEIALSNQEVVLAKKTSTYQQVALCILGLSLAALLLFYRRTLKDRKTIASQKLTLQKSLTEKVTLLKEIHHRIKNNLQMVSGLLDIQAIKLDDPRFEEVITDSQRYINSMALVHQMLYQTHNASTVSIDRYLTDLTSETLRGLGDNNLKPTLRLDPQEFRLEQSIPLGLILCELITNTYKHAYPDKEGEIHIHLTQHGELFTFKYKDFGKGLPTDETETTTGVGQNLITLFAEEIGATLHIQNTNGLEYSFTFSKA